MTLARRLADHVERLRTGRRVLVAFDGPDAAGKTTLARGVAAETSRPAVSVSVDDWHHPRALRLGRGEESPEGYYLDSFDVDALVRSCLEPFAAGAGRIRTACFDHVRDEPVEVEQEVGDDAVLLIDGVFLLRPELRARWDLSVYLHVPEAVTLARAEQRDAHLLGGAEAVRRRYERRYLPGQALYREAAAPADHADVLVDNCDAAAPLVLRWPARQDS